MTDWEKHNREEFFKLMKENPDLPIFPMIDCEIACEDYGRFLGAWGNSYIDKERVYFREDNDPSEVERVLSEEYGHDNYMDMDDEQQAKAYADMPWIKAIIVDIDLPR